MSSEDNAIEPYLPKVFLCGLCIDPIQVYHCYEAFRIAINFELKVGTPNRIISGISLSGIGTEHHVLLF